MNNFNSNQKNIGIFGILLFGLSIITLGKYNISKLFDTPLGRIWLLFLLIGTSLTNYKLGCVLLVLILLLHTYITTIEGMDTLNKDDNKKSQGPSSQPQGPEEGTGKKSDTVPRGGSGEKGDTGPKGIPSTKSSAKQKGPQGQGVSSSASAYDANAVKPVQDESKLLQGEGANLLDIERNITKNSKALPITNNQNTENVLPNNPGKEAFQSNYQLL